MQSKHMSIKIANLRDQIRPEVQSFLPNNSQNPLMEATRSIAAQVRASHVSVKSIPLTV